MKPLYAKDKRDACIIVAVNYRKYDLGDIDEILENQRLTKLSKGIEYRIYYILTIMVGISFYSEVYNCNQTKEGEMNMKKKIL